MAQQQEYVIDGSRIVSLDAFYNEISRVLIPGHKWGRNLSSWAPKRWSRSTTMRLLWCPAR
jgi:hypothetical protein